MKRLALAITIVLASLAARLAPLRAQDAARPALDVVAAGSPDTLAQMAARVRSLESRLPVRVHWAERTAIDSREVLGSAAGASGVVARVWLDLTDAARALLFVANASQDRFLVRVVPTSRGYDELTQESLATIIESALDALLAGGQIGVDSGTALHEIERETAAPLAPVPVPLPLPVPVPLPVPSLSPTPKPSPSRTLLLSLEYRGDALMRGPALRHGAQLGLAWTGFFEPSFDLLLALTAHAFAPFALEQHGRGVTQQGGGARAALGAAGRRGSFGWQAALAAGVELAHAKPTIAVESGLVPADPFWVTLPIGSVFVRGSWRMAKWLELLVGVGLDVDLAGHHFDVAQGAGRSPALSPWRAHPYWLVGLAMPWTRDAKGNE